MPILNRVNFENICEMSAVSIVDFDQLNDSWDVSNNFYIVMPVTYVRNIVVIGFAELIGLSTSSKDRVL